MNEVEFQFYKRQLDEEFNERIEDYDRQIGRNAARLYTEPAPFSGRPSDMRAALVLQSDVLPLR